MKEEQMIILRDQKDLALKALSENITNEQRARLNDVIQSIDNEMKKAHLIRVSEILPKRDEFEETQSLIENAENY